MSVVPSLFQPWRVAPPVGSLLAFLLPVVVGCNPFFIDPQESSSWRVVYITTSPACEEINDLVPSMLLRQIGALNPDLTLEEQTQMGFEAWLTELAETAARGVKRTPLPVRVHASRIIEAYQKCGVIHVSTGFVERAFICSALGSAGSLEHSWGVHAEFPASWPEIGVALGRDVSIEERARALSVTLDQELDGDWMFSVFPLYLVSLCSAMDYLEHAARIRSVRLFADKLWADMTIFFTWLVLHESHHHWSAGEPPLPQVERENAADEFAAEHTAGLIGRLKGTYGMRLHKDPGSLLRDVFEGTDVAVEGRRSPTSEDYRSFDERSETIDQDESIKRAGLNEGSIFDRALFSDVPTTEAFLARGALHAGQRR